MPKRKSKKDKTDPLQASEIDHLQTLIDQMIDRKAIHAVQG